MKTAIILAALLLIGSPWEKNPDKVAPEPEPAAVVEAETVTVPEAAEVEPAAELTETAAVSTEPEPEPVVYTEPEWPNSATMTITHYCSCSKCCGKLKPTASGVWPQAGRTVAVDPAVIPLGSEVLIGGHVYIAEDTGSGVDGCWVDIFCDSHQEALNKGLYSATVCWR